MPGIPSYANQLDQAYHYYGSKNLLDPSMPASESPLCTFYINWHHLLYLKRTKLSSKNMRSPTGCRM